MALSDSALKDLIISECESQGFVTSGSHANLDKLAEAIAKAVVAHITAAAEVPIDSGSSAGTYKVT